MYQVHVGEVPFFTTTAKNEAVVIIGYSTGKEMNLIIAGRVRDALDLMNDFEQFINRNNEEDFTGFFLAMERKLRRMTSYDSTNK